VLNNAGSTWRSTHADVVVTLSQFKKSQIK
jgi:hypothetical protein